MGLRHRSTRRRIRVHPRPTLSDRPRTPGHFLRRLPTGQRQIPFLGRPRASGTGLHAGRYLLVGMAVALQRDASALIPARHPAEADHGTHPAANAALRVAGDDADGGSWVRFYAGYGLRGNDAMRALSLDNKVPSPETTPPFSVRNKGAQKVALKIHRRGNLSTFWQVVR